MKLQMDRRKDLLAGLIFIVIGIAAFAMSQSYRIGTLLDMGPGYFPALIGAILVVLGGGSLLAGLRNPAPDPIARLDIEPLFLVLAGALSFAFLIERAGLLVAIAALMFFACFRRLLSNPVEVILTYAILAGFSALVFVRALGLPIAVFWWKS